MPNDMQMESRTMLNRYAEMGLEYKESIWYNAELPGCGPAWSGRLTGGQEAVSSNLTTPTVRTGSLTGIGFLFVGNPHKK